MKRRVFDIIFILLSGLTLMALSAFGLIEKYAGFALIPILIAYQLGKYAERKFKK